jgi:epoxyqueuosine reductase QueG
MGDIGRMSEENYGELNELALSLGIDLFGVCPIEKEVERFHKDIREWASEMDYAISLGLGLSRGVFETIVDGPNDIYKTHYRQANTILDTASFRLARHIHRKGYKAMPIAASFTVDEMMQRGHVSHRWMAELAGIGWRGRNNLLVTNEFGAAVRLTTILTDIPLAVDKPMEFSCGDCYECISECPAQALGEYPEDYNFDQCYQQLVTYSKRNNFGLMICGHCIKACRPKIENI